MKKIIALALSLMMLLICAAAFGEDAEKQTITMAGFFSISYDKLPEYYSMEVEEDSDMHFHAKLTSEDASKPMLYFSIDFNDKWSDIRTLADVSEDDILSIQDDFYRVSELNEGDLIFSDAETGRGTKLMVALDKDGSAASVYTIYMGHEVEIALYSGTAGNPVTDEDVQAVIQFITDIDFTPVEGAE